MFETNDCVFVGAPTGSAAFKAFGETIHRLFAVPVRSSCSAEMKSLSGRNTALLTKRYQRTIAGLCDEPSLLSLTSMGYASHNFKQTAFGGCYHGQDAFCDIPVFILVGDDYQLPPVGRGVFEIPLDDDASIRHFSRAEYLGMDVFKHCAQDVMVLSKKKRQVGGQKEFERILDNARISALSFADADKLIDELHLVRGNYTASDRAAIENKAVFISANREPVDEYNFQRLASVCTESNPVAIVKSATSGKNEVGVSRHFDSGCPVTAHVCVGAKVSLQGRNFNPAWGLYNGSIGVVDEIVFLPGDNPNEGDQPLYVVVDFSSYCGPVWDPEKPKCVPIPCITYDCMNHCCERTSCPLVLSFARTIDKFQGQTGGPNELGRPPHDVECIILDPGSRSFEARGKTGISYCMLGRGTTIGELDEQGRRMDSAIYFHDFGLGCAGTPLSAPRLAELQGPIGQPFKKYNAIIRRDKWVEHLLTNSHPSGLTDADIDYLFHWATTTKIHPTRVDSWIKKIIRSSVPDVP